MSEEQLKAFLEKVKDDISLQEKLKAAAIPDAVLSIAKEAGFMISTDDLTKAQAEVSDEELEGAPGGAIGPDRTGWCTLMCVSHKVISTVNCCPGGSTKGKIVWPCNK